MLPYILKCLISHQTPQIRFRDDVSNQKKVLIKGMDKGLYESKGTWTYKSFMFKILFMSVNINWFKYLTVQIIDLLC